MLQTLEKTFEAAEQMNEDLEITEIDGVFCQPRSQGFPLEGGRGGKGPYFA